MKWEHTFGIIILQGFTIYKDRLVRANVTEFKKVDSVVQNHRPTELKDGILLWLKRKFLKRNPYDLLLLNT